MNKNISKKIVATITALTVLSWIGPALPASADTISDLQAQIAALLAQINTLQAQLNALQGGGTAGTPAACTGITFTVNLSQGSSGASVKCLQALLNQSTDTQVAASGAGSPGNETTYFGSLTKAAVIKFQVKYASEVLTPLGLTAGTGLVGTKTRAKLNAMLGGAGAVCGNGTCEAGETTTSCPTDCPSGAGQNKVSLAADTPAAATVALNAQNVIFMKLNFCAASEANTISKIIITRGGIAADADISAIKLYEGTTQKGSSQALNSTTHKATFSSLNWTIPANSCKVLTVKASIAAAGIAGDTPKLSIAAATDITSTVTLDGVFPLLSNGMTIAGISAGWVEITTSTSPSGSVIAGATEQSVAEFKFTSSSTEAVKIHSVKVTEVGSSVDADVANIKLFYQSTQLGSTVAALSNGSADFDFSATPLEILAGNTKTLTVYVDVGTGTSIKDRNIKFQITQASDVTAYGSNSGGSVNIYGSTEDADEWPLKGQQIEIDLGSLTITKDTTYTPSDTSYSRGTADDSIVAFKFTAGPYEGARISQIKLREASTTLSDSDITNVSLYDAVTGALIAGPAGVISGYVTFGTYSTGLDSPGLFDIEKSKFRQILVKADVSSAAATGTNSLGFVIVNGSTDVKADGLESQNDLSSSEITANASLGSDTTHDIIEKGTLTVGPNSNTPSASTYAVGTFDFTFAKFDLTSTGEDIKVTQFNVFFSTTSNATSSAATAEAADINNLELYDGDTLLKTDANISSGYAEFAINITVPKNGTKVLTVKGDIPTGSDADGLQAWLQKPGDVTAEGVSSGVAIRTTAASWSTVRGNYMTQGVPGLVIKRADTPASATIVKNTSGAHVATMYLTASTSEDLTITRIKIAGAASSSASSSVTQGRLVFNTPQETGIGLVTRNMVGKVKLYDGTTQLGTVVPAMISGTNYDYADFTGLSLKIPKGTTKAIDIKLDVTDSTTSSGDTAVYFFFGIASGTADVAGSGDQSGTALSSTSITVNGLGEPGNGMRFGAAGSLTVTADIDTAVSAIQVAGSTGVNFGSWKFIASNEGINITRLAFIITTSTADVASSTGYAASINSNLFAIATSGMLKVFSRDYCFSYSIDDTATATCYYWWGPVATTTVLLERVFNSASSTCFATTSAGGTTASTSIQMASPTSDTALKLYASSSSGTVHSLEISDCYSAASNTADNLKLGLKYGGTETLSLYDGSEASLGTVYLYDGTTLVGTSYVGTDETGKVVFSWTDSSPLSIPKGSKILTLKADLNAYTALTEGATLKFTLGGTVGTGLAIEGKGAQSGTALTESSVATTSLAANDMYFYSTKPTVTKNANSPTTGTLGTNEPVFRFDVTNANSGLDMAINAIRFTIKTNASTSIFDKTFTLYKSSDESTAIGSGVSYANATTADSTGWVTIYPYSSTGWQVGSGSTNNYVLKANTSNMNESSSKTEYFTVSIEVDDFFWDDSVLITGASNANKKTIPTAVSGNQLSF